MSTEKMCEAGLLHSRKPEVNWRVNAKPCQTDKQTRVDPERRWFHLGVRAVLRPCCSGRQGAEEHVPCAVGNDPRAASHHVDTASHSQRPTVHESIPVSAWDQREQLASW